ncbi:isopentenyl phosphate kinase family protein [archaeon]|nr:isopentenyl phosphate kinase family protein [archaeon]
MEELILMKLGGSVITEKNKPDTEMLDVIKRVVKEIHEARQERDFKLIVGHGGGSYPHVPASQFKTNEGVINDNSYEGIAKVQDAASRLNRIIVRELINAGENALSIQLSACCVAENGRLKDMYLKPIKMLLDFNMLPVPHGDVALDINQGCCILSTEEVLSYLARQESFFKDYQLKRIIVCGRVDGVFTGDPESQDSELIKEITPNTLPQIEDYLAESSGIDVTGGMVHKVKRMMEITDKNIQTEIINALRPNYVKRALLGEKNLGTVIKND